MSERVLLIYYTIGIHWHQTIHTLNTNTFRIIKLESLILTPVIENTSNIMYYTYHEDACLLNLNKLIFHISHWYCEHYSPNAYNTKKCYLHITVLNNYNTKQSTKKNYYYTQHEPARV